MFNKFIPIFFLIFFYLMISGCAGYSVSYDASGQSLSERTGWQAR